MNNYQKNVRDKWPIEQKVLFTCTDKYTLLKLGTCNDFEIIVSTEEPQLSFLISFKVIFEKLRCSLIINYRKYFSKNLSFLLWVD